MALAGLLAAGAGVLVLDLVLGLPDVAAAYRANAPDLGAALGLTVLALGYLPNAVLAGTSWMLGPGVAVGTAGASPFATYGRPALDLSVAGRVPHDSRPGVGRRGAGAAGSGRGADRAALLPGAAGATAAGRGRGRVLAAVTMGWLALFAGGRLAAGPFDPVRLPVELLVLAVLGLVGVPAVLVVRLRRGRPAAAAADPEGGAGESAPGGDELLEAEAEAGAASVAEVGESDGPGGDGAAGSAGGVDSDRGSGSGRLDDR